VVAFPTTIGVVGAVLAPLPAAGGAPAALFPDGRLEREHGPASLPRAARVGYTPGRSPDALRGRRRW
jgi:hypothetical protein